MFPLVALLALLCSCPLALGQPAKVPVPVQPGLTCTPWSWRLCKLVAPKVYQVMVDAEGGGGMQAPGHFMNGDFSLDMRIPPGNSGGVNFAWYLMDTISPTNKDPKHAEIDFEIYGNATAGTVLLTTNVFANGMQNLAQYSTPWDASAALHTYGIRWNKQQIVWTLDGKVLRVLNYVPGQPWPRFAMKPMASVWATPWTALQADFTKGPITALYGNYKAAGCPAVALTVATAAPIQCAGPWNALLTPAELAVHKVFSDPLLIVNYGWDKA